MWFCVSSAMLRQLYYYTFEFSIFNVFKVWSWAYNTIYSSQYGRTIIKWDNRYMKTSRKSTRVREHCDGYNIIRISRVLYISIYNYRVLRRLHFFPSPSTQFIIITLMDPVCFFPPRPSTPPPRFVCVNIMHGEHIQWHP